MRIKLFILLALIIFIGLIIFKSILIPLYKDIRTSFVKSRSDMEKIEKKLKRKPRKTRKK